MVMFKNPRDASQIQHLTRQMYPKDPEKVMTLGLYGYPFIDLKQETPDNMRLRAYIRKSKKENKLV